MSGTRLWILAILALMGLSLWSIKWLPPVGMDDTLYSSVSHNFVREGRFAWTMVRPIADFHENELITGRLHLFGLAATGFIFDPSILSDRLWPLCMALVSLLIFWQLTKYSLGPPWVAPSLALCMAEPMFFSYSHMPRPEMAMTAIFLFAIFCGMKALDEKGNIWIFLAGLSGTLAIDVHLPGIILAPGIGIALVLSRMKLWSIRRDLLWFMAGALIGLLWYFAWHILSDPQLYLLQWKFHSIVNKIIKSGLGAFIAQIPTEFSRYRQWFWGPGIRWIRIFEAMLILSGIIIQLRSSNIKRRYLSITSLSLMFIMALAVHRKTVYYLLPLYPLFILHELAVFRFILDLRSSPFIKKTPAIIAKNLRFAAMAGIIALFGFYLIQNLVKIDRFRKSNYDRYVSEITDVIPEGAVVAASPSLWYSLGQRNNLLATPAILWAIDCNEIIGYKNLSVSGIMKEENVEFVVMDPYIRNIINNENNGSGGQLSAFIKSNGSLVKAFRNEGYIGVGECREGELTEVFAVGIPHAAAAVRH